MIKTILITLALMITILCLAGGSLGFLGGLIGLITGIVGAVVGILAGIFGALVGVAAGILGALMPVIFLILIVAGIIQLIKLI